MHDLKFDETYTCCKKALESEFDKIYNKKTKSFIKPNKLEDGYKAFRGDVKKIVDKKVLKSVKTAAVPAAFCAAYISFILGRLTMKYNPDKTTKTPII